MTTTTTLTPTAHLHAQVRTWLADRRQHFVPSPVANAGWYGAAYLLTDFVKHTRGHSHMAQRDFRRMLKAVGLPVVKAGNLWHVGLNTSAHSRPRTRTQPQQQVTAVADLFADPTQQNPGH